MKSPVACIASLIVLIAGSHSSGRATEVRQFGKHYGVASLAFSPDGEHLLVGPVAAPLSPDPVVRLWDISTGGEVRRLEGHQDTVTSVCFSPDGKLAYSGGTSIRVWDVARGEQVQDFEGGGRCMALSPNGKNMLVGRGNAVDLLDLSTGKIARRFGGHKGTVNSVALTRDGKLAASGGGDGIVQLWEVETGKKLRQLRGADAWISSVAFSPDGNHLLSASGQDPLVRLFDVANGAEVRQFKGHWVTPASLQSAVVSTVVFSVDGKRFLSAGGDNTLRLWEVESAKQLHRFTVSKGGFAAAAFSPDGKHVAGGGADGFVRLWRLPK